VQPETSNFGPREWLLVAGIVVVIVAGMVPTFLAPGRTDAPRQGVTKNVNAP
jgi:hypothetical protein